MLLNQVTDFQVTCFYELELQMVCWFCAVVCLSHWLVLITIVVGHNGPLVRVWEGRLRCRRLAAARFSEDFLNLLTHGVSDCDPLAISAAASALVAAD